MDVASGVQVMSSAQDHVQPEGGSRKTAAAGGTYLYMYDTCSRSM